MTSSAGRLPKPARAPNPEVLKTSLSRSVRKASQMRGVEIPSVMNNSSIVGGLRQGFTRALGKLEHARLETVEERQDLGRLHDVGIFCVHVAEVDRMARLRAIEAAFLGQCHAVVVAERIEHSCAHA